MGKKRQLPMFDMHQARVLDSQNSSHDYSLAGICDLSRPASTLGGNRLDSS